MRASSPRPRRCGGPCSAVIALGFLSAASCDHEPPTPEGIGLVQHDTTRLIPDDVRTRLQGTSRTQHVRTVPIGAGNDAEVEARFSTATDPAGGGEYIVVVRLVVRRNDRYRLSASQAGEPINRGTAEHPVMGLSYLVTWTDAESRTSGSRHFELVADGRLELR